MVVCRISCTVISKRIFGDKLVVVVVKADEELGLELLPLKAEQAALLLPAKPARGVITAQAGWIKLATCSTIVRLSSWICWHRWASCPTSSPSRGGPTAEKLSKPPALPTTPKDNFNDIFMVL